MKKLLPIILILLPLSAAADMLVCDAPPAEEAVTHYKVFDNDVEIEANSPAHTDGSLRHDLGVIDSGVHNYTAIACNERGCSDSSVPLHLPSVAGVPQNLEWTKQL